MAISVAVAVGNAGDRLIEALQPELAATRARPGIRQPAPTWARWSPANTGSGCCRYVDTGVAEGAKLVVDGRQQRRLPGRRFLPRSVLCSTASTPAMRIYREEIFGPVLVVVRAPDLEAALALVSRP